MSSMREYAAFITATRAPLADPASIYDLVRFATLAANGHNTQPWRFRIGTSQVLMIADVARRTPVVDPDDHHLFVSLGCALANLSIAAAARGLHADSNLHDAEQGRLAVHFEPGPRENSPLFEAIPRRQATRSVYDGRSVSEADLRLLLGAARVPGVDIVVITEKQMMEQILELIIEGNTAQIQDVAFVRELKEWIRFNPRSAMQKGDGLFSASTGSPIVPTWLGSLFFNRFFRVDSENKKYTNQVRSSAGLAVFVSEREDKESYTSWSKLPALCAAGDGARDQARLPQPTRRGSPLSDTARSNRGSAESPAGSCDAFRLRARATFFASSLGCRLGRT